MTQHAASFITEFPEQLSQPGLLLLCTASGRVFFTSGSLRLLLSEDLTGRNLNDFLEDATVAKLVSETQAGRDMSFECTLLGRRFTCGATPVENNIQIDLFPLSSDGGVFMTIHSARFVTREINNNLAVMLPALQRLQEHLLPEEADTAAILRRSIYRMLRLSRNVEDCAAAENGLLHMHYSEEDLSALCGQLAQQVRTCCDGTNIQLLFRGTDTPLICRVDGEKVRRMVLNLLSNAIAAQKNGGTIALSVSKKESAAVISVTDSGRGIDGDLFDGIFRKFDRLDPTEAVSAGGAGFGLALTRAFAEKHGGHFVLMSNPSGGTSAQIILPENQDAQLDTLHAMSSSYGSGIDPVLVELSTVLGREAFRL